MNKIKELKELRTACGFTQTMLGAMFVPPINSGWMCHIEYEEKPFPISRLGQIDDVIGRLTSIRDVLQAQGIETTNRHLKSGRPKRK